MCVPILRSIGTKLTKFNKIKRPMLYNGVFGCHGNTCYVIFIAAFFFI